MLLQCNINAIILSFGIYQKMPSYDTIETVKKEIVVVNKRDDDVVKCPKCGSKQVEFVTSTNGKGVSSTKVCCGYVLLGPLGAICGLSGAGKTQSKTVRKCKNCGYEF